jgi:hypothetical protein
MAEPRLVSIELVSGGERGRMELLNGLLTHQSDTREMTFELDYEERALARLLMQQPDMPFLGNRVRTRIINDIGRASVSNIYKTLIKTLDNPIADHFVRVGYGSATHYGLLSDNYDPQLFCERGIQQAELFAEADEKVEKRQRPFKHMLDYYNGVEPSRFAEHKKGIAGAAVLVFGIGSAAIYMGTHKQTSD